jgi:rhodanese-related sulfurtransferase
MTLFPLQGPGANPQVAMTAAVFVGFAFGFVLERAGFGNARKLAAQFYGTEMVMLKVMFTAIVTAVLGVTVLSGLGLADLRALGDAIATDTFLWPMIAGGFLIGVGIIFSGYCPGTSLVGVGSGKLDALVAYAGVVVGQLLWAEVETRGAFARFHASGARGHLYLYDLLHVRPAILAAALVLVAIGAFLVGEKVERAVTGAPAAAGDAARAWVFRGVGALGGVALATLAVPVGTAAVAPAAGAIGAPELARRALDEPWKVRVLDVRPVADCAAARVPGSECTPAETLKALSLGDLSPARDLVVVTATGADLPRDALAYPGRVLVLEGGFAAWKAFALDEGAPPPPGAAAAELDAWRFRAGLRAALTGVKQAPPPVPAAGGAAPAKRKAGGGGCSG